MKVFISWSGDQSKGVAEVLRQWFPSVLQAVRPYFSPDDISKGTRWSAEIAKELEASRVGLLVVTPDNQSAPWLLFEAGALAKNLDRSKVCPILFGGLEPTDVEGPLVQFQAAQFSKDEMRRVVRMVNGELGDAALSAGILDGVFEMWWPNLEAQIKQAVEDNQEADGKTRRSERDLLEEVLALTRRLANERSHRPIAEHPAWDDLGLNLSRLARTIIERTRDREIINAMRKVMGPLEYIQRRYGVRSRSARLEMESLRNVLLELEHLLEADLNTKAASPPAGAVGDDDETPV